MRLSRNLIVAAAALFCSAGMNAQSTESDLGYKPYPYGFVQVQGGINKIFSPQSKVNPTFSIGGGYMFTSVVGTRLHFNGYETKNGFNSLPGQNYKFRYLTSDIDLMINLVNIFSKQAKSTFDVYLIGGIGLTYAWHNNDFQSLKPTENVSNAWGTQTTRKNLLSHNARVGILADYNISKHWSIGVEADFNSLSDRFNSKYNDKDDWMFTAQLSVTYKFGHKKAEKVATPVTTTNSYDESEAQAEAARAAARRAEAEEAARLEAQRKAAEAAKVAEAEIPLKETAYFQIRESDPKGSAVLDKVVEWCNKYPNKKITISGYADKGTGTPAVNMKYSKQRAQRVAKALQAKGIAASRMTVNAYGDTVQPYANNDDNRCTIVVGE